MIRRVLIGSWSGINLKSKIQSLKWFALSALILGLCLPVEAQKTGKVYRVGWLRFSPRPPSGPTHVAFRQGMRELGYVEGRNLVIEYRSAKGKPERRLEMAAQLVRLKVDVIVTSPAPPQIRAAQQATRTIPIVMSGTNVDPVTAGFVVSLARPGGNVTGLTNIDSKLHPKRLELLKEAFPQISRVAILWSPTHREQAEKEVEAVGKALGIHIQSVVAATGYVKPLDELKNAFSAINRGRPEALLVASFGLTFVHRTRIIDFAAERRIPAIYARRQFMDAGGLMSYSADLQHLNRRVSSYVDKILKGANPADLPVEQPTKFELVINLKTAKQIGLTIPPQFLARADKVIK